MVLVLAAALLLFGATELRNMPVDALPEFSPPTVEVQSQAPTCSGPGRWSPRG